MPKTQACVALLVQRVYVKRVKSALEVHDLLEKTRRITQHTKADAKDDNISWMSIPTRIGITKDPNDGEDDELGSETRTRVFNLLTEIGLEDIQDDVSLSYYVSHNEPVNINAVLKALRIALQELPKDLLQSLNLTIETLISTFPESYTIYRPMLLLPHNTFSSNPWMNLLSTYPPTSPVFHTFWTNFANTAGVTHIATNAGIPLSHSTSASENILRSPTNLTSLHGTFGPMPSPQTLAHPTHQDFKDALWVTHTQNGIHQTWAPLYTMFSRGNIREKSRLLTLPAVSAAAEDARGCTAVDLYAGIGYFVFSYRKAGIRRVLCWELNPWSVEGLERGARLNGWKTQTFSAKAQIESGSVDASADFLVFAESNEEALGRLESLKRQVEVKPIRHVNLGFLPSSKLSWGTAVGLVDRELGGWVHAHENVGTKDIEKRAAEVVAEMRGYLGPGAGGAEREVRCEHIERVKTYAPGVLHVVFDIWIGGAQKDEA